jgi:hypothetical protein
MTGEHNPTMGGKLYPIIDSPPWAAAAFDRHRWCSYPLRCPLLFFPVWQKTQNGGRAIHRLFPLAAKTNSRTHPVAALHEHRPAPREAMSIPLKKIKPIFSTGY